MTAERFNLTLVVPAFNEEKRIASLRMPMLNMAKEWGRFELIIVDDGSTDQTTSCISELESDLKECIDFVSLQLDKNVGKGGALRAGVEHAKGEFILTLDADMSAEPTELIRWLEDASNMNLDSNSIFIADRTHKESNISSKFKRRFLGGVFNFVVRITMGLSNRDTQCGFKLYPASIAKSLFSNIQYLGWVHDLELLYQAHLSGVVIVDMPIKWSHKDGGQIQLWSAGFSMLSKIRPIMKIVKKRLRK